MRTIRSNSALAIVMAFSLVTWTGSAWGQVAAPAAPADAQAAPADKPDEGRAPGSAVGAVTVATATVAAVDPPQRMVILQTADNDMIPIRCGEKVRNFDQIKPGDEVTAVALDRMVVAVGKGDAAEDATGRAIFRMPEGERPGIMIVDTARIAETIASVDADNRTVTLRGADGKPATVRVAKEVDLSLVKAGENVNLTLTRGIALIVSKPQADAQPAAAAVKPQAPLDQGEPGAAAAAAGAGGAAGVMSASATVEAIDPEKRLVTLKGSAGGTRTIHLGENAINFDQIAVGDKVRATLAEGIALSVDKPGAAPAAAEAKAEGVVARAPKGSKPGIIIAESSQVAGKIQSVDADKGTVTLTDADGKSRTLKAGPKVDLSKWKAGDEVSARVTDALAIVVEKPSP